MGKKKKTPKYEKIALDIAYRIYNGDFKEGEKVSGRSTLAGRYNVSPETIRRAMELLNEVGAVEIFNKKGIVIKSRRNANVYIKRHETRENILNLRKENEKLIKKRREIEQRIDENTEAIIEYSLQLRHIGLVYPYEVKINNNSNIIGKSINETRFWQNTKATIIGVSRGGDLLFSPGPDLHFKKGDTILFIGNKGSYERVRNFIED
ncbi:MAG: GntR family transcriptional regulator [Firmicutes bacterium]|nr:GntR family transcriptional regulator [Bacillota bacterium]